MAVINIASGPGLFDTLVSRLNESSQNSSDLNALAAAGIPTGGPAQGGILNRLQGLFGQQQPAPVSQVAQAAPQPAPAAAPAPALPSFAAAQGAPQNKGLGDLFASAQSKYGVPPGYLPRLAYIESKFDPNAVSSTGAAGLYQFTKGTASQYGLANPHDLASSTDAVGQLTADNMAGLTRALGRAPTQGELYLSHQQGLGGAIKLLSNPNARAGDVVGDKAVRVNGGNPDMPAGAFASMWTSKFGGGSAPVQTAGDSVTPPAWYRPTRQPDAKPGVVMARPGAAAASDDDDAAPQAPQQIAPQAMAAPPAAPGLPMPTPQQIGALIQNPGTREFGLKLWQASLQKTAEPFTLSAGQARFDGAGHQIAVAPEGDYTLSQGQSRFRGSQQIAAVAPKDDANSYEYKEVNGHLVAVSKSDPNDVRDVTPAGAVSDTMFGGRSVEGQGLNELVRTGQLTRDQAAQFAAGKTVTDPSTGAVTFLTPAGVFKTVQPQQAQSQGIAQQPGAAPPSNPGMIPLTPPKQERFTEQQTNAALYSTRMQQADKIISDPKLLDAQQSTLEHMRADVPHIGNRLVSSEYQQADQAQRDFVNAVLRRESGAAISETEFESARKQYFPQPGDGKEVLAQKAANRATAIAGIRNAAAGAYKSMADDLPAQPATARTIATPQVGTVESGYRYKGGDPAQQSSWEKAQ